MKKKIIAVVIAFIISTQSAYASVIGTKISDWSLKFAHNTDIYNTVFMSGQDGVGRQTEFYAKYTPNTKVVPVVVSGNSLWGRRDIKEAEAYMRDNQLVPLVGINASYFSLQTGIPMGHVIEDGKIMTKDSDIYESVGFLPTGEAFIAPLDIKTELLFEDLVIDIPHINKYNQETTNIVNLYTNDYGESNHSEISALTMILGEIDGSLAVGKELTCVVEEKFIYNSSIKIPDGKIVLTLNEAADVELFEKLNSLEIGDRVTISSKTTTDERWNEATGAIGSVGETLIKNGELGTDFPSGAAPRTAIGVTESGDIIFYVLDGRQSGYSYGARLDTLAVRMQELGCVDAINLDGGGSTVISGVYPGEDISSVINSPSDNGLRKCANYVFLKNNQKPTEIADKLHIYPFEEHYLSGYTDKLKVLATDSEFYSADVPNNIDFYVAGTKSKVNENGELIARGSGEFTVTATNGNISGKTKFYTYETPTKIDVFDDKNNIIEELVLEKGDVLTLFAKAEYNNIQLKSTNDCFKFELSDDFGYIEGNTLTITDDVKEGVLKVSAGEFTKEIPITVNDKLPFNDIKNHWAKDNILQMYGQNLISGYETPEGLLFMPDENMTREEFSVVVANLLDADIKNYENYDLSRFEDERAISDWSRAYVASVVDKRLITGKDNEGILNFAPKDHITRAEAMTILGRIIGESEAEFTFSDEADIPSWSKGYISKMVSLGVVTGYEDNSIKPLANIKRAEVITLINKLLKAIES